MAIACPVDLDTLKLRAEIQSIYARVAADPSGEFHFHRGPEYASTRLNYDAEELSKLPGTVTESFAGVGNSHAIAPLLAWPVRFFPPISSRWTGSSVVIRNTSGSSMNRRDTRLVASRSRIHETSGTSELGLDCKTSDDNFAGIRFAHSSIQPRRWSTSFAGQASSWSVEVARGRGVRMCTDTANTGC